MEMNARYLDGYYYRVTILSIMDHSTREKITGSIPETACNLQSRAPEFTIKNQACFSPT